MFVRPSQVFLCHDFVDFRKSINGLSQIVEEDSEGDNETELTEQQLNWLLEG